MFNSKSIYYSTLCLLIFSDAADTVSSQQLAESHELHPVRQDLVDEIKSKTKKWKPREIDSNHFRGKTLQEIRDGTIGNLDQAVPKMSSNQDIFDVLGVNYQSSKNAGIFGSLQSMYEQTLSSVSQTLQSGVKKQSIDDLKFKLDSLDDTTRERQRVAESIRPKKEKITGDARLPAHYFYRESYPMCNPRVLNQQMCGSCWAFSGAGMLEDRFCIHTDGQIEVTLSPQDMVNCDFENYGCKGGYMVPAIDFLITEGVAEYDCLPYKNERFPCSFRCEDSEKPYDKYYCRPGSMKIETDVEGIQADIYHNGPVMVGLMVYEDLYSYESGIYEYTAGGLIGGHSIRAVGWGHDEDGHLYWICQNQWTDMWGTQGFVNIKAGEVGIDYWSLSCLPDIKIVQ